MGDDLKRQLVYRMRRVAWLASQTPPKVDGAKLQLNISGEVLDLATYGQRLQDAYANENETDAVHLLSVIL